MVPIKQVRAAGERREYPFYPDHGINALDPTDTGLIYWTLRIGKNGVTPERDIRNQLTILKARYEIPLVKLPYINKIAEDLTLTRWLSTFGTALLTEVPQKFQKHSTPDLFLPTDDQPVEYLRFNRRSREDILGVRLDYQFTQRLSVIGGFQYRKFTNRDNNFRNYLQTFPADTRVPNLYRSDLRTRIFEIQAINRGSWLGFYIVILAGHRRTTHLFEHKRSNTTFVRAMMGF